MSEEGKARTDGTREKLLRAARRVIGEKGVLALTLAEVAATAGVSKGGLLYHFPNKTSLLGALVDFEVEEFERDVSAAAQNDSAPGAWTRGYIRASFNEARTGHSTSAVIGSLLLEPSLVPIYARHIQRWGERLNQDGLPEDKTQLIRFAVEGLWFDEIFGMRPLGPEARARYIESLIALTAT